GGGEPVREGATPRPDLRRRHQEQRTEDGGRAEGERQRVRKRQAERAILEQQRPERGRGGEHAGRPDGDQTFHCTPSTTERTSGSPLSCGRSGMFSSSLSPCAFDTRFKRYDPSTSV